jgi:uncharacterized protein YfaS (alpha-2-macroglobulin family)
VAYSLIAPSSYVRFKSSASLDLSYKIAGKEYQVKTDKKIYFTNVDIEDQPVQVELSNTSGTSIFVNYAITGKLPVGKELPVQSNLIATTVYTDRDGKTIDIATLNQATEVIATTTIKNNTGLPVSDLAFTRFVPSGWEIVNTRFTDYGDSTATQGLDYTDIKDDRVYYYFDLPARESKTIKTILNASYLGTYYLPGIQCEAMYDEEYVVRNNGKWVKVIR